MEQNTRKLLVTIYGSNKLKREAAFPEDIEVDEGILWDLNPDTGCNMLSEYDAIVADFEQPVLLPNQRIEQLDEFLDSTNGIFIFIMNRYVAESATNYDFVNRMLFTKIAQEANVLRTGHHGEKIQLTPMGRKSAFADYLRSGGGKWVTLLKEEFKENVVPLATNASEDIVAFSLKGYSDRVFFIPWLNNKELFWDTVIRLLRSRNLMLEPAPEWVSKYFPPKLKAEQEKITDVEQRILELEIEKKGHENTRDQLVLLRETLLSRDGIVLQNTVRDVLRELGLDAKDGAQGEEDLTFVENEVHFVAEVKGLKKSAAESHVAELHKHRGTYEAANGVKAKAVLIVNPWRELPLEERNTSSERNFPDNVLKKANLFEVALLTTQQLFVAYCQMLDGKFNKDEFIEKLLKTNGVFEGLNEIEKYKEEIGNHGKS